MNRLEDDVYGFGFILLEALVGPSVSAKSQANLLNVMVCKKKGYMCVCVGIRGIKN